MSDNPLRERVEACPFCGQQSFAYESNINRGIWVVRCYNDPCGATGPSREKKRWAIDAWNERAILATPEPSRGDLRQRIAGTMFGIMIAFAGGESIMSPAEGLEAWKELFPDRKELLLSAADRILSLLPASDAGLREAQFDAERFAESSGKLAVENMELREAGGKLYHVILYRDEHDQPASHCFTAAEDEAMHEWEKATHALARHEVWEDITVICSRCGGCGKEAGHLGLSNFSCTKCGGSGQLKEEPHE